MTQTHPEAMPERAARPARKRRGGSSALLGIAVFSLVVGLSVGRFVTYRPGPEVATQQAAAVPAQTVQQRLADLERAVAENPEDLAAWQALGSTAVARATQSGDPAFYALAEQAFDHADDLAADAPETLLGRGSLALALHEFTDALRIGRLAVEALPDNAQALAIVVDAQVELGRYEAAALTLQRMLDVRPDLPALARVSYLRQLHGDLEGAGAAMRQAAVAGSPSAFDLAVVAGLRGEIALAGGDTDTAADAYTEAQRLAPGYESAEVGLARVQAIRGDTTGAIERLSSLVDRLPTPAAATLLSELQTVAGDQQGARNSAEVVRSVALLQESQGQTVDLEMALFEADRGDEPERAVSLARRAYRTRPGNVFAADALAWSLHRAGRSEDAAPFAAQAIRLSTADALLRYHAAEIFAATGDVDRARGQLEAAIELTPWFSFAGLPDAAALAARIDVPVPENWAR